MATIKRNVTGLSVALLVAALPVEGQEVSRLDRFQLLSWSSDVNEPCPSVSIDVQVIGDYIGLT